MQDKAPREAFSKSIPGTLRMADIFSAKTGLVAGDNCSVDWVPGANPGVQQAGFQLLGCHPASAGAEWPQCGNSAAIWSSRSTTASGAAAATGSPWL